MPTETLTDFDTFAISLRFAAAEIATTLTDDAPDFCPMMMLQLPDGAFTKPIDLSTNLRSAEHKASLWRALPQWIWNADARMVGLVLGSWRVLLTPNADGSPVHMADRAAPGDDPAREECVCITVASFGRVESWHAAVLRGVDGVTLGPWSHVVQTPERSGGDMVTALWAAFA